MLVVFTLTRANSFDICDSYSCFSFFSCIVCVGRSNGGGEFSVKIKTITNFEGILKNNCLVLMPDVSLVDISGGIPALLGLSMPVIG